MPGKIDRIFRSIEENAGDNVCKAVKQNCDETDIKNILSEIGKTCDEQVVVRVMKSCGRQCIPKSYISRAISIYDGSDGIEDFLRRLNPTRIGGGQLHLRDGKIIGIYDKCYCGLVKKLNGLPSLYCYCSAGWYERLFSSVFDRPVEVTKIKTIPDGANHCEFEIRFGER